jgi:hypothetical protein
MSSTSPALRLLPRREAQPPFDDEIGVTAPNGLPGQHALALAFALPGGLPAVPGLPDALREVPDQAPRLRLVPPIGEPGAEPGAESIPDVQPNPDGQPNPDVQPGAPRRRTSRDLIDEEFGPQQTPRALLPEPKPWAGRLVQAVVEVTSGVRPVSQLVRWTTTEVYDVVQRRQTRALNGARAHAPLRLAEVVRSVRVSEPIDGVAEVCAILQQGPRCRAIALRLEGIDGRWQCTALQIG